MEQAGRLERLRFARWLIGICLVGFAMRLGVRSALGTQDYWHSGYSLYAELADNVLAGRGYGLGGEATAYRVPLYPLFIAAAKWLDPSPWLFVALQAAVATGTVACAGLIGRALFGARAGLWAAALCAVYPYYLWHDLALQETALFTFLTAFATLLLLWMRARGSATLALATGIVLGLAILTRAMLAPFAVCAVVWLLVAGGGPGLRNRALRAAVVAASCLLVLSPWLIRAERITGSYGLGTEFASSLFVGNHGLTFAAYPERSIDESRALIFASLSPAKRADFAKTGHDQAAVGAWFSRNALATMRAHPGRTLAGGGIKLWAAFGPLPSPRHGPMVDWAYAAVWLPLLGLAAAGLWMSRANGRRDSLFYAHFASFCVVTALLWAHTSHRAYLDVYLIVFAAGTLARMIRRGDGGDRLAAGEEAHQLTR